MKHFTVHTSLQSPAYGVKGDYMQHEDNVLYIKTSDGTPVAAFPMDKVEAVLAEERLSMNVPTHKPGGNGLVKSSAVSCVTSDCNCKPTSV